MEEPSIRKASLPKGYSFVPKGNIFITGNCRRRTQVAGRKVYVVVDNGGKKQLGIGVPTNVYLEVQLDEMSTRAERASNVQKRDDVIEKGFKEAITKEFPHIPAEVVPIVLKRALEKGKGKVGRTSTLDLSRKAILAVRAHIRHMHTNYDVLLRRGTGRDEARLAVAAKVGDIAGAWKRIGDQTPGRTSPRGKPHEPSTKRQKATPSSRHAVPAKRVQAETSKPKSPNQQSTDPSARRMELSGRGRGHPNKGDATNSAHSTIRNVDEMHLGMISKLISQIQCTERKAKRSESSLTTEKSSGRRLGNPQTRGIRHRQATLSSRRKLNDLLEQSGLQRVDKSMDLESIAKQLKLSTPEPTATCQIPSPTRTSTPQTRTRRALAQNQTTIGHKRGPSASGDATIQREPHKKARVFIDLTKSSDEDDVVSIETKTTTRQEHNKETSRRDMEASWDVGGKQISDATARELRRELRELGVGNTVKPLPLKRHAALEADRVLSRRLHSRTANRAAE